MARRLTAEPTVDPSALVHASTLGRYTEVGARTKVLETTLDDYSYVVNDSDIAYARIGRFVSIASHARINPGNHPTWRAAQAHFTYRANAYWPDEEDDVSFFEWRRNQPVVIGHDVWIGHGTIVLAGRSIGVGAVVGAGSVVTKDVEPYTIVVGNPARELRRRFPEPISSRLERLAWWAWSHERLRAALPDFRSLSVEEFIEKHER